ncbi:MAG TPA: hypothetical protein VL426_07695 [Candidatus Binatia bacterium]|jgi:hypothetical protein|nr:hypothetical protein [Candidatus Binatia bacterium]
MEAPQNKLIVPAAIIAAGIVLAAVVFRVLPAPGRLAAFRDAAPDDGQGSTIIPGSAKASPVTAVRGDRISVSLASLPGKHRPSITLVVRPATLMLDAQGVTMKDRRIRANDLIDFTPTDFPEDAAEVDAESITLVFRPPER